MRRLAWVLSIVVGLCCLSACHKVEYNGQTGKILHKKYDPALNINYSYSESEQTWDTVRIDLDQDNITDLKVYFEYDIPFIQAMNDWQICILSSDNLNITDSNWWGKGIHVFYDSAHPIAVVQSTENGSYYGWLDAYSSVGSDGQQNVIRFYLRETAYCTCLNYPLKWGEK
ncbi:MAG: hypothetical protein IKX35_04485 [Bacteroidales bacterium]|nr:hypothetical protein [Bacteroidales bacterium]